MLLSLLTAAALAAEAPAPSTEPVRAPQPGLEVPVLLPLEASPDLDPAAAALLHKGWWASSAALALSLGAAVTLARPALGPGGEDAYGGVLASRLTTVALVPTAGLSVALLLSAHTLDQDAVLGPPSLALAAGGSLAAAGAVFALNPSRWPVSLALLMVTPALAFGQANRSLLQSHGSGAGEAWLQGAARGLTVLGLVSAAGMWVGVLVYEGSAAAPGLGALGASMAIPVLSVAGLGANLCLVTHGALSGGPIVVGLVGAGAAVLGASQILNSSGEQWATGAALLSVAPLLAGAQWMRVGEAQLGLAPTRGGAMAGLSWRF